MTLSPFAFSLRSFFFFLALSLSLFFIKYLYISPNQSSRYSNIKTKNRWEIKKLRRINHKKNQERTLSLVILFTRRRQVFLSQMKKTRENIDPVFVIKDCIICMLFLLRCILYNFNFIFIPLSDQICLGFSFCFFSFCCLHRIIFNFGIYICY